MGLPMITTTTAQHSPEIAYPSPTWQPALEETRPRMRRGWFVLRDPERLAKMRAARPGLKYRWKRWRRIL
jgi:hypothetical protein